MKGPILQPATHLAQAREILVRSNVLWYGLTAALVSGVPIILLPFLLSRLPATEYANVVSMQIIVMFGGLSITLGMDGSVARDALRARPRHLATHVVLALITQSVMFVILGALAFAVGRKLESWIEYPSNFLVLTLLGCFFQQITLFTANLMRLLGHVHRYVLLSISQAVLEIGLSLALLYTVAPSWEARLWGFLGGSVVTATGALLLLARTGLIGRPRHAKRIVRRMLNFGLPTLPHSLFSMLAAWADRFILIRFCGAAVAGVYAAAGQSVMITNFVGSVVNLAWTPWLYRQLSERHPTTQTQSHIRQTTHLLLAALAFVGAGILGVLWAYFRWLAPVAYRDALSLLPWLALGATFNAMYRVVSNYLFFYGQTRQLAGIAFFILAISLVGQFVFVPLYQGIASALVFALINFLQLACTWFLTTRLFPLNRRSTATSQ